MEELSIEEKAKRYDEAIAVINKSETDKYGCIIGIKPSDIFPELKESEDERTKKEITELVMQPTWKTVKEFNRRRELCDWIKKQGEKDEEILILKDKIESLHAAIKAVKETHKIELEKQGSQNPDNSAKTCKDEQNQEHYELKAGHWYICHRAYCCRADHLTVKEGERFMCEKDGIVKGFEIKEPEKYFKEVCAPALMEGLQKSAWSEEDEKMFSNVIDTLKPLSQVTPSGYAINSMIDWLKSLKSRHTWMPSDEQMEVLNWCKPLWNEPKTKAVLESLIEDLKKLRKE